MSVSSNFSIAYQSGQDVLTGMIPVSADSATLLSVALGAASNNVSYVANIPTAAGKLKGLFILSTVACTILTNSASAPQDTINLAAGVPLEWTSGAGSQPFLATAPITKIFVSNVLAGQLDLRALYLAT